MGYAPVGAKKNDAERAAAFPALADLLNSVNALSCGVQRLATAATRAAAELGERRGDRFEHAPVGEWPVLVSQTAVNLAGAGSLVAFAEGRPGLIERLSPVNDAPLREVLGHILALGNALALMDSSLGETNLRSEVGGEKGRGETQETST